MRKIVFFLLLVETGLAQTWEWQNPLPGTNGFEDICRVSANEAWGVGASGTIAKTSDGGLTWRYQYSGRTAILSAVHFVDNQNGWAVGANVVILRTTDGGENWTLQYTSGNPSYAFDGVYFTDANNGWVVGMYGMIYHTSDGGINWVAQTSGTTAYLNDVFFIDTNHGWVVGNTGTILFTADAGATWTPQTSGITSNLYGVHFESSTMGWTTGSSGQIRKTTDGGTIWNQQTSGTTNTLYSLHFEDSNNGWVVGASGTILHTTNGGTSWPAQTSPITATLKSVAFSGLSNGIVMASPTGGRILRTTNGGTTWTQVGPTGSTSAGNDIHFADTSNGWCVGSSGAIVHTTNGGDTWTEQVSGTSSTLYAVYAINETTAVAVGSGGTIRRTVNAGATWTTATSGITSGLYGVFFPTSNIGYAVGSSGVIRFSNDGGQTWTGQTSGITTVLYDVFFINDQLGWAVGGSGWVVRTSNGGATWTPATASTNADLRCVSFRDENTGIIAGDPLSVDGDGVRMTYDGGATWGDSPSFFYYDQRVWYDAFFSADNEIWLVGFTGIMARSGDGGDSWHDMRFSPGTTGSLNSITMIDYDHAWSCGTSGIILSLLGRTSIRVDSPNGGETWLVGEPQSITWTSERALFGTCMVRINRSYPAGPWTVVTSSTPNDGEYEWVVAGATSSSARIEVKDLWGDVLDVSDADFTISELLSPPDDLVIQFASPYVELHWSPVAGPPGLLYQVYRDSVATGLFENLIGATSDTFFVDSTSVSPDSIRAFYAVGVSTP